MATFAEDLRTDAYAELGLELGWGDEDDGTRDLKNDIIDVLVPFISGAVLRHTAASLSKTYLAARDKKDLKGRRRANPQYNDGYRMGMEDAARIVRAFPGESCGVDV